MKKHILITGGAGFIGSNIAHRFARHGATVTIFDNFQRYGTRDNASWLTKQFPDVRVLEGDIRNPDMLIDAVKGNDIIFHMAAQVAVTTSVLDPRHDFEVNALGTFNLLEAVRQSKQKPIILFASTNKVYGGMEDVEVIEEKTRYMYKDLPYGISEAMNLDFHSPYGCSKGAADQYVRDYARMYGIPTVVFRQSCIYGPRQFGIEDQGWVAWFIIANALGKSVTVYGDGKQIRDVLFIDDLVDAFEVAVSNISVSAGKIYNVGGGIDHTLSVWCEFQPHLEKIFKRKIQPKFADWRPGDQKVYVSDIRKIKTELGWEPKTRVKEGIEQLSQWILANTSLFEKLFSP